MHHDYVLADCFWISVTFIALCIGANAVGMELEACLTRILASTAAIAINRANPFWS